MGGTNRKSGSKPSTPRYGKSGQQSKAPSYGNAMQGAMNWGGQALQGGSGKGSGGQSGGKGGQPFPAAGYAPALGQAMGSAGAALGGAMGTGNATPQPTPWQASTGAAAPSGQWQNYAGMTANPNPSMPPQVGAPQTGAFPYPQQAQPVGAPSQPAGQPAGQPAQSSGSLYQPNNDFYNQVNQVLGAKQMAQKGQYDQGWNAESSPNSRAAAAADAQKMEQALGRPLTSEEKRQLQQRALGWGFNPVQAMQPGWEQGLGQTIAAIQAGQNVGQPTF